MKALYRIRIVAFAIDGIPSLILYYRISSSLFPNFAPVGADEVGHVQRMLQIKPAQLKYLLVGIVKSKSMNSPICVGHVLALLGTTMGPTGSEHNPW